MYFSVILDGLTEVQFCGSLRLSNTRHRLCWRQFHVQNARKTVETQLFNSCPLYCSCSDPCFSSLSYVSSDPNSACLIAHVTHTISSVKLLEKTPRKEKLQRAEIRIFQKGHLSLFHYGAQWGRVSAKIFNWKPWWENKPQAVVTL